MTEEQAQRELEVYAYEARLAMSQRADDFMWAIPDLCGDGDDQ